ncbi:MAG: ADP-ribosylglycohydrolase family protein, partial [Proteobacteria bacterium]|nr:ADP-ribosylglycohydrolase family protein [Pseudomonadota bacterium]
GYVYHTVPAVIHAWMAYPEDFRNALLDIIGCGGDTDTTGAILGAIVGAGAAELAGEPGGCGCTTGSPVGASLIGVFILGLALRRRQTSGD